MFATLKKLFGTSTSMKPRNRHSFRPELEGLEERTLMAGNITATLASGTLTLTEATGQAGLDNAVQINRLANGVVRVEGLATGDGTKSLINGAAFKDFSVPLETGGLSIQFGAGRDKVLIGNNGNILSLKSASISVGNDFVESGSDPARHRDEVQIANMTTINGLTMNTGAGDDAVQIAGSRFGSLNIKMGRGNDFLDIQRATVDNSVSVNMDPFVETNHRDDFGQDTVRVDGLTVKSVFKVVTDPALRSDGITPSTLGGIDSVSMSHVTASEIRVNTLAGDDTVKLYDVHAPLVFIRLGAGDDTLNLLHVAAGFDVTGGSGFDQLFFNDVSFEPTAPGLTGFEDVHTFQVDPGILDRVIQGTLTAI